MENKKVAGSWGRLLREPSIRLRACTGVKMAEGGVQKPLYA